MAINSYETKNTYLTALVHFNSYLSNQNMTADSIISKLLKPKADVYVLLQGFVSYLAQMKLSPNSKRVVIRGVRSYLGFHGIDIIPSRFKARVKTFKVPREDAEALDIETIRKLLSSCNNRRLKAFLLCLASGGFRVKELCAVRHRDLDFNKSPTKVHVRAEYTKMRKSRDIYISDEATRHLKQWIAWQHREDKYRRIEYNVDNLVFAVQVDYTSPEGMYKSLNPEWHKVLESCGLNQMRDGMLRHAITLHAFRSFTKSQLADHVNSDYSEWALGHSASTYYKHTETERRKLYEKAMPYLTFLDFDAALDISQKDIKDQLNEQMLANLTQKQKVSELEAKIKDMEVQQKDIIQMFKEKLAAWEEYGSKTDEERKLEHEMELRKAFAPGKYKHVKLMEERDGKWQEILPLWE
jgi:integrase